MATMNFKQSKEVNRRIIEIQNIAITFDRIQTCTNCQMWDKINQKCKQFGVLPPAEVIVTGCEEWLYIIPF